MRFPQYWTTLRKLAFLKRFFGSGSSSITSLRGPSPLTLTNAVKGKLRKLVQFGKVSVSDGVITCNNGVLSVVDGEIITTGTAEEITVTDSDNNTQTATAVNLYAVDGLCDEQDIITGKTIRRTEAVISDGSTPSGRYVGDNTAGNVIIKARETLHTGDIVSFEAEEEKPINLISAEFSPVQDLHGYDSPWPAGGGKNLFNGTFMQGYWAYANGTWTDDAKWIATQKIACKSSTYYTASADNRQTRWQGFVYYDSNGDYISTSNTNRKTTIGYSAETPANAAFLVYNIAGQSSTSDPISPSDVTHFQLEEGQTSTSYAPYSNECPISGWTGATVYDTDINVWDEQTEVGGINSSDGSNKDTITDRLRSKNYISVKPNTAYCLSIPSGGAWLYWYDASKDYISRYNCGAGYTFTTPSNCYYIRFELFSSYGTTYNNDISINYPSINYPSTDTAYYAYNPNSWKISVTWQDEAGTVYGGHLRINRDGSVDLIGNEISVDLTGTSISAAWFDADASRASIGFYCDARNWTNNTGYPNPVDTVALFSYCKRGNVYNNDYFWRANFLFAGGRYNRFEVRLPKAVLADISTAPDAFNSAKDYLDAHPLQAVYQITPVTYHLPSISALKSYIGKNNIWSNANGSLSVAVSDGDVIEQGTPHSITVEDGTNTISWSAEVEGKEMEVEYRTAPTNSPIRALNILLNGNYENNSGPDEPTDKEALDIIMGRK